MKIKPLQDHQMDWVTKNQTIFRVSIRLTEDQLMNLFNIYNSITGENKRVTTCGRCLEGVKKQVFGQYLKQMSNI